MKSVLLAVVLFVFASPIAAQNFFAPPDAPSVSTNPEFPLHVHIFAAHWNRVRDSYQGFGRGDLLGDSPTGFDFTYSCDQPFLQNAQPSEFYQARWKNQDPKKLVLLMQKVGSGHLHRCQLNVVLKPVPYGSYAVPVGADPK